MNRKGLNLFLKRLLRHSALPLREQGVILNLPTQSKTVRRFADIVFPDQITNSACLIVKGLAGRFDQMRDGRRQTTALHIAGDMCDLHSVVQPKASWSISALTDVDLVFIPHAALYKASYENPEIAIAFWRDGVADASILAKWIGNLGRKDATARLAHLFCEMGVRMEVAKLGERCHYPLSMTQVQLAEALGLTSVHVNRVLRSLRTRSIFDYQRGIVKIENWNVLTSIAEFDDAYLSVLSQV